jgi:hypothetical protein
MSLFPIVGEKIALSTAVPVATDNYVNGILTDATNALARAATTGGAQTSDGLLFSNDGRVIYVDATLGLPANTNYTNGIPTAPTGELCISTDVATTYSNGLPYAANGAISATISV